MSLPKWLKTPGVVRSWALSGVISTLLLLGLVATWASISQGLISREPSKAAPGVVPVLSPEASDAYWQKQQVYFNTRHVSEKPVFRPTGVSITSLEFNSHDKIRVGGFIWQSFPSDSPSQRDIGWDAPFRIGDGHPEDLVSQEFRYDTADKQIVGWSFSTNIKLNFDYSDFPLDSQVLNLAIRPKDSENTVLVPDFAGYPSLEAYDNAALSSDIIVPGWRLAQSFFGYIEPPSISLIPVQVLPKFVFNIVFARQPIHASFSHLVLLVVVLLLLFAVLTTSSKESAKLHLLGFNAAAVVAVCASLFFPTAVTHFELRDSLGGSGGYIESFYILTYFAILGVAINSMVFALDIHFRFFEYNDNILPKLFYWPVILGTLLVITLIHFYI